MRKRKQKAVTLTPWQKIKRLPKKYTITGAIAAVIGIFYGIVFFIDKPVVFSYAGDTCVRQVTLLPGLHDLSGKSDFNVYAAQHIKIGSLSVASLKACFKPASAPSAGNHKVAIAPFGGWFGKKTFSIDVASPPVAQVSALNKPVPVSRPLTLPLSETDKIFTYHMKVADNKVACDSKDKATSCDVRKLGLLQGKPYSVELIRQFGDEKIGTVVKKDIVTLSATHITDSSVKAGELVYAKPKTFEMTFDKQVVKADSMLYRIEGDKRTPVPTTMTLGEKKLILTTAEDLPRSIDYELAIDSLEASDGSGLEAPYKLPFKTSGGPKVTGINVGRTGVAMGATAVITFDQPLSDKQDISKAVALAGGAAVSSKKSNQLFVSLAGVPKCGDFSIKITGDIQSNYDIAGNSAWSFGGRVVCHTVGSIGTSSKGRAITAYYFGSGPRTVVYTGAIHGNETGTALLMERWMQELEANAGKIPADKSIVIVPRINPDGIASGSRTNARNVDLNRNFGTSDWKKDITDVNNRPFPGGGGEAPMSEPETRAIAGLVSRLRPVVVLSYHSIGGVVAANQTGSSTTYASRYSQLSGYRNTTGQTGETFEYSVSGTADDYYGERLGVASVLIELGSHTSPQFERNSAAMWAMVNL